MVTKKQVNTTSEIVLNCIEQLKRSYQSTFFLGKFEKEIGKAYRTIQIKYTNKITYDYPMTEAEYLEFKKLEKGLWVK